MGVWQETSSAPCQELGAEEPEGTPGHPSVRGGSKLETC